MIKFERTRVQGRDLFVLAIPDARGGEARMYLSPEDAVNFGLHVQEEIAVRELDRMTVGS